tara:strand:+ start:1647 stop:2087 length:441 start_codon:yes stop_codon:yes gene_type:complete
MTDKAMVKKKGRPKKDLIESKKKGNRGAVGRPKGDADAIREYKARLLASPKSRKVIDSILNAALDDNHKSQSAAWKLLIDRIMPLSYFDKDKNLGGKAAVNIVITGVGGETTIIGEEPKDITDITDIADVEEVNIHDSDEEEKESS